MTHVWVTTDVDERDTYEVVVTVTVKAESMTQALLAVAEVIGTALMDNT